MRKAFFIKVLLGVFVSLTAVKQLSASIDPPVIQVLDGGLNQLTTGSSVMVEDAKFFDVAYNSLLIKPYATKSRVSFRINETSDYFLKSAFSATITLRITYTLADGSTTVEDKAFTINYDSTQGYTHNSAYVVDNVYRVNVEVLSRTTNVSWDVWKALMVEDMLQSFPQYHFNCEEKAIESVDHDALDSLTTSDELPVSWGSVIGADEYDLEWTYIDSSALYAGLYGTPSSPNPALIFKNNASRVTITSTAYNIPLIYDAKGILFFRVRPVQLKADGGRKEAYWSTEHLPGGLGKFIFNGHQRNLNWQSTTSYAEDGKRKVVVQYYDGSLRSRQTVTKDNSTNNVIVAESIYDYQGRPVVQVLPAPTLKTIIAYSRNFNAQMNGGAYDKGRFDSLPDPAGYCTDTAFAMLTDSGAARYYSPNNPEVNTGFHKYIPDAKGFPFTQVEFTPDNTGRISRQGGVGPDFKIGSGHETKYYYGTPDQRELDALFGTEVGDRWHYFKTMVRDANGQYSVSYTDMRGRTIATALAGKPVQKLDTLEYNLSKNITETLSDPSSAVIKDLVMESKKGLLVSTAGVHTFNYSLTPESLELEGCDSTICYDCLYDLEITITDDCNNQKLGGQAFDTVIHNFSIGAIDTTCNNAAPGFSISFVKYLEEGSYEITKRLSVSRDAINYYRDSVFMKKNACKNLDSFIREQRDLIAMIGLCKPACASCRDSLGTWEDFHDRFMKGAGIAEADTAAYLDMALTAYRIADSTCQQLCKPSTEYQDIRKSMLLDMTAPSGQYANLDNADDIYSIFFSSVDGTSPDTAASYQSITNYLDENGRPDSVFDERTQTLVPPQKLSPEAFVQNFKLSWAEALLPLHPEYCRFKRYEALNSSHSWDRRFEAVDNFAEARHKGYLNPTNTSGSPFNLFNGDAPDPDSLATYYSNGTNHYLDSLNQHLTRYRYNNINGSGISLWSLATAMVMCKGTDASCYSTYGSNANAFDTTNMCTADLDMAWRFFRQMYLDVKRELINRRLAVSPCNTPSATTLLNAGHQPHFSEPGELAGLNNLNLGTDTAAASAQAQASMNAYYAATCAAYTTQWWLQLKPCGFTDADTAIIFPRLRQVCRDGSDVSHPYGASTTKPGNYQYKSFEEVLKKYIDSVGARLQYNSTCNAFLINAPQPYDQQSIYSLKPVYQKPDSCECTLIKKYHDEYESHNTGPLFLTFAEYLQQTMGVITTDGTLDSLLMACNNEINCNYLDHPLFIPTIMQCGVSNPCADCGLVKRVYQQYIDEFPDAIPAYDNNDTLQRRYNQLFTNFMNSKLGFAKAHWEYLAFLDTCNIDPSDTSLYNLPTDTSSVNCTQLKDLDDLFYYTYIDPVGREAYVEMRTFAGNQTPAEGPKGVFDVKGNLIGNTVSGSVDDINTSYASIWNSSAVNQVVGVLTYLPDSNIFKIHLNPGQKVPCEGVIGMRYYKFDGYTDDTLSFFWTSVGSYIDFGDSTYFKVPASSYIDSQFWVVRQSTMGGYNEYKTTLPADYIPLNRTSVSRFYPHTANRVSRTVTVYHTDVKGQVGFEDPGPYDTIPQFTNLRGYFPQQLIEMQFNGTRDSTINRTDSIYNWDSISSLQYVQFNNSQVRPSPMLHNNFGSFANNHNIKRLWLQPNFQLLPNYQTAGVVDGLAGKLISENFPNFNVNFSDVRFLLLSAWNKREYDYDNFNFELPYLKFADIGFQDLQSYQIDSILIQLARASVTSNGGLVYHAAVPGPIHSPTSASSAAVSTLTSLGWGMGDINSVSLPNWSGNPRFSASDVVPMHDKFTEFFNQQLGTSMTYDQVRAYYLQKCSRYPNICSRTIDTLRLCGKSIPVFPPAVLDSVDNCSDSTFFIVSKSTELYKAYVDSLKNQFDTAYRAKCLDAYKYESFTVTHAVSEYHYTLYYYDQAGNLVKTVPPQGVQANYDSLWLDSVKLARSLGQVKLPAHTLITQYRYNTLNQVVAQHSPDGGTSEFWYDRLGRLTLSSNAKQKANGSGEEGRLYSYTEYDILGRITEVGQVKNNSDNGAMTDDIARNASDLSDWHLAIANYRGQITKTGYDLAFSGFGDPAPIVQRNLRNRVSFTTYTDSSHLMSFNTGTFYTYDIHGNVDTLLQHYGNCQLAGLANIMNKNSNGYKKIVYRYDLISGKVNHVAYNPHNIDEFYHKYTYDAENRLILVETSQDSVIWETDARYDYYRHGPLARTVLGGQLVQGIDYAYSLQGWLKGVNGISLNVDHDMGNDGKSGAQNQFVARDAVGFGLNYFNGDYNPINSGVNPFPGHSGGLNPDVHRPLYNGNISSMAVNIRQFGTPYLYNYRYDQLNRITGMDAYTGLYTDSNKWKTTLDTTGFYKERIAYDANGNILKYLRNGDKLYVESMDSLNYIYYSGTNRLRRVRDNVGEFNYFLVDVEDQSSTNNYVYDEIGNMISDAKENITDIKWTVYGKIKEITRTGDGSNPVSKIIYDYDAAGNRISKRVKNYNSSDTTFTWYVRDAQGNVMATYSAVGNGSLSSLALTLQESHLYGSSRLGVRTRNISAEDGWFPFPNRSDSRGYRQYELTNHLGNVLSTISDRKVGVQSVVDTNLVAYFNPVVINATDYYPFGMPMPARTYYGSTNYRYGFNGKENDWEAKGAQNQIAFESRIYDPRVGRFLSRDPLERRYPFQSTYVFAANNPIRLIDHKGEGASDWIKRKDAQGRTHFKWEPKATSQSSTPAGYEYVGRQYRYASEDGTAINLWGNGTWSSSFATVGSPTDPPAMPAPSYGAEKIDFSKLNYTRATISMPNPRERYSDYEYGMITSPATQATALTLCPGCAVAVGGYQTYSGIKSGDYVEAGSGMLTMAGGALGIYGQSSRWFTIKPPKSAYTQLLEKEAATGGHFVSRHGAQTSLASQYQRAISGLTPEGQVLNEVNSTRFLSHDVQLEAVKLAEAQFAQTGKSFFTFDMGKIVGEGFLKGGGSGSYRFTSMVTAAFKDGQLLTLFPLISK